MQIIGEAAFHHNLWSVEGLLMKSVPHERAWEVARPEPINSGTTTGDLTGLAARRSGRLTSLSEGGGEGACHAPTQQVGSYPLTSCEQQGRPPLTGKTKPHRFL